MLVQVINDSILTHSLTTSFVVPMKWLSLAASTTLYNKSMGIITFKMESNKSKWLNKDFAQILKLPSDGVFEEVMSEQVLHMLNEMGY